VVDDVGEVFRGETVVDRHQDGADLRDGVERLELGMGVRRDVRHPVILLHTEVLQRRRPTVGAVEEFAVSQAQVTIHDSLALRVEAAGSASELQGTQGDFDLTSPLFVKGGACNVAWNGSGLHVPVIDRGEVRILRPPPLAPRLY
jgi:hypothetical protein